MLLQDSREDRHLLLSWSVGGLLLLLEPLREPFNYCVTFALDLGGSLLLSKGVYSLIDRVCLLA